MKLVAFIPSRYESKRFPGKPLTLIGGRPMIQHVYSCARSSSELDEVYVATDDERIYRCVEGFGGRAVMTGTVHPSGTDRVAEAASILDLDEDVLVINIQGDQPFFNPALISDLIAVLKDDPAASMGTLKHRIEEEEEIYDKNIVKLVTDHEGYALYFSRSPVPCFRERQSSADYYRHLGFYIYRRGFLSRFSSLPVGKLESAEKLEQLRALEFGFRIKVAETSFDSKEVDTPQDAKRVEKMIAEAGPDGR